jgi:hypothetical protein
MKVMLKNVRLSFPDLFEAKGFQGSPPKFSATFLINKTENGELAYAPLMKAIDDVSKTAWRGKADSVVKQLMGNTQRWPVKDGDDKDYDGYKGHYSLKASNAARPLVVDRERNPVAESDGVVYAGCYVNALVDVWAQDNKYGKAINVKLQGVQFAKDGETFGAGGGARVEDFDEISGGDDEIKW